MGRRNFFRRVWAVTIEIVEPHKDHDPDNEGQEEAEGDDHDQAAEVIRHDSEAPLPVDFGEKQKPFGARAVPKRPQRVKPQPRMRGQNYIRRLN